jgi:RNA polymerase sigma-70 factor (ECF subfamily)
MIWTIPRGRTPFFTRWHGALSGATSASPFDGATPGDSEPSTAGKAQKLEAREAAFEQFFHAHEATILGYLWRITGDEQASHDIAQETFLRAWQRFEQISRYDQPRAWLFRVATNLASNHRRHRSIHDATLAHISPTQAPAPDPATGVAESAAVRAALLAMPIRQRSALVLRVVYGLSILEIAEALGATKAATAMTLSRARDGFRAHYAQEDA